MAVAYWCAMSNQSVPSTESCLHCKSNDEHWWARSLAPGVRAAAAHVIHTSGEKARMCAGTPSIHSQATSEGPQGTRASR
jgi:hypothetical protein